MRVDDNIDLAESGETSCTHCGTVLGVRSEPLRDAIVHERDSQSAGPGVHVAAPEFTDRPIVLRQRFCPECLVVLATEIVPSDERELRGWSLA